MCQDTCPVGRLEDAPESLWEVGTERILFHPKAACQRPPPPGTNLVLLLWLSGYLGKSVIVLFVWF